MSENEILESMTEVVIKRAWIAEDGDFYMELGDTRIIKVRAGSRLRQHVMEVK